MSWEPLEVPEKSLEEKPLKLLGRASVPLLLPWLFASESRGRGDLGRVAALLRLPLARPAGS